MSLNVKRPTQYLRQVQTSVMSSKKPCTACMTIPAVVTHDYEPKGEYLEYAELKTYVVSPTPSPKSGIIFIYDIFGASDQAHQGADLIALTHPGNMVVMPDFFKGNHLPDDTVPPNTPEKMAILTNFMGDGPANIPRAIAKIQEILKIFKSEEKFSSVEKWGIIGFCWGGKVATLASISSPDFSASVQCHPTRLDAKEVEKLKEPHLILASNGEDEPTVLECGNILSSRGNASRTEYYKDMIHGWMGARADLQDGKQRMGYEEGYKDVIKFFSQTLS